MKGHIRLIVIIPAVMLIISACQIDGSRESTDENGSRTYYESLNLKTPEDAVITFSNAFQREDFMTVYLVLDAEAQRLQRFAWTSTFSWEHLIGEEATEGLKDDLDFGELTDTQYDPWYVFDQIMDYAAKEDDLLIDLRGDLNIRSIEESESLNGEGSAGVISNVDGVAGEVYFVMTTDRDGRWRVYSVSAPEEGVNSWPFEVPNSSP